jgi:hypothetical protein
MTKFIEPEEARREIADVLVKALGRGITDDEINTNMKENFKSMHK